MKLFHLVALSAALSFIFLSSTSNGVQLQSFLKTTPNLRIFNGARPDVVYRNGGIVREATIQYEQTTALQVAKDRASNDLYVDVNPQDIDEQTRQTTHFLPWAPNRGTFMQLSHAAFGEWFFTSRLTGCEIWIAHDRNPNTQPLIMHINTNACQNEQEAGEREELGRAVLTRYNINGRHYELLHRIMKDLNSNPLVYPDPAGYLNGLHERFPHVQLTIYDDSALFYGMHRQPYFCEDENAAYYGGWTFHLRNTERLQFYQMRDPGNSIASTLCRWLRFLSGGYIGGRKKRQTQPTLCDYMNTTCRRLAQSGKLNLSETEGILMGTVPNEQTLYISELFPASSGIGAPFNKLPVETIQYTCSSTELHITTRAIDTLTILPGILELSNVSITLNATLSPVGVQFFMITANWGIGNVNGHFTIEDNLETSQLLVRGDPQGTISLNFEDMIEALTGKRLSLPVGSVSFRDVEVTGAIDTFTSGSATFSICGKHGQNNVVHIILQKGVSNSGAKYAGAFAAEFSSFRFADLIRNFTGADISGVPFLGSIVVPTMAVTASTADISSASLLRVFEAGSLLQLSNGYIQGGVTAYFHLSAMNNAPVKMSDSNSRFSFEVLLGRSVSLRSLLSQVGVNLDSVPLPPGISDVLNLNIMCFSINTSTWELRIDASFPNTLSYFDGLLKIQNVVVSVHAMLKAPRSISVEARGHLEIGTEMFEVQIKRDSSTNRYIFEVLMGQSVSLLPLLSQVGVNLDSVPLPPGISNVLNLNIMCFSINTSTWELCIDASFPNTLSYFDGLLKIQNVVVSVHAMLKAPRSISVEARGHLEIGTEMFEVQIKRDSSTNRYIFEVLMGQSVSLLPLLSQVGVNLDSVPLPPGISSVLNLNIMCFSINTSTWELRIDASFPNTLSYFDGLLKIQNVVLSVHAMLKAPRSISVEARGHLEIGTEMFEVQIKRDSSTNQYIFEVLMGRSVSLLPLLSQVGVNLDSVPLPPGISDVLNLNIMCFSINTSTWELRIDASFPNTLSYFDGLLKIQNVVVSVHAMLKAPGSISVEASGHLEIGTEMFEVQIKRDSSTNRYIFEVLLGRSVSLLPLLSQMGVNLDSVPLPPGISNVLNLNIMCFSINTSTWELRIDASFPNTLSYFDGLLKIQNVVLSVHAMLKAPRSISVEASGHLEIGTEMFEVQIKQDSSTNRYIFEVLMGRSVSLRSLLSQVGVNLDSVPLPPGISDILNLNIMCFSINTSTWELRIDASFPNTLSYFDGLLKIQNVVLSVHAILKAPRSISVEASGHLEIGTEMFEVQIKRDSSTNRYILSSQILELHVTDIIEDFGAAVFPDEVSDIIMTSGFFDFSIKNMNVSYSFGSRPLQIHMSGSPVINGYEGPYIYMIMIKQGGQTALVQGFELGATNLADLVKTFSGLDLRSIAIFNQQLEAAILISPVTLPGVTLQGDQLSGFSINNGISLQAKMTWPPDCSSDLLCNVAQTLLGQNARLMFQGTITNTQSYSLMAGVSDIRLGSLFTLKSAGFGVTVLGPEIQIGIFGNLQISNPDITLNGVISVGTRGAVLELTMTGCWERAFGADWLCICSLQGLVALKPALAFLPGGLAVGGEVKIGKPSCHQIQATGFVGIDADMPQENYYYVDIHDELTLRSVLDLFCIDISLPRPLAESGFPEGFMSSFSLLGKELPHVPLSIPLGFRLKGMFNILGLTATVDVTIGLPRGIKIVVLLPPLDLANGLLTMYASRDDSSTGPYLNANIGLLSPNVNIKASGYVSVLGISVEATLRITNNQYQMSIEGRMLGLFQASLEITASYRNIRSASFRVRGTFKSDLCNRVKGIIEDALRSSSEQATRAIDAAQREVNKKKAILDDATRELSGAQAELDRCQRKFDNAVAELEKARADVRGVCTPPTCRSVCVPAPCGTTCVATAWGVCVLIRPTFSSCCFRAPNLLCEAERAGCIALRETLTLVLRAAEVVVDQSRIVLDAAILALEVAKGAVNAAKIPFDAAVLALEAIEQTYRVGVEAANQIARFGLGGVVNLKEIRFDVSLRVAAGGSFAGTVRGCLVGNNVQLDINVNLHDVTAIARQVADHVIDGLSSVF